ncbi:MAG: hypothetical protein HZB30_07010 [Nitrospirae bacterium]|nr:hypothetical protein [Nitrospirota bacterium]
MSKTTEITSIISTLSKLNMQRTNYIFSLVHGKSLVHGLPHKVFRKCGKNNCKCKRGELHGPYYALSVNKDGKKKIVMIKKADHRLILKEAGRYQYYQKKLAHIRKINKEIDVLLEKLKFITTKYYP